MLFSVVIPVFNCESFLNDAIDSVLSQDYHDFEIVVVDDGSSDGSGAIADAYAAAHGNVYVLHDPNQGLLLARRKGLLHAKGEYVLFLDADDQFKAGAFARIAQVIKDTGADIVSFRLSRESSFIIPNGGIGGLEAGFYGVDAYRRIKEHVCRGRFNNLCGKALRLSCVDVGAPYEAYEGLMHGEDLFQLLPIVDAAGSLAQIDDVLYFYRPNEGSSTAKYKSSQLSDIVLVNRRLRDYARRWENSCPPAAVCGESDQYFYLLKMSELGCGSSEGKAAAFDEIRRAMFNEGVFDRMRGVAIRPDNRALAFCIARGWHGAARAVVRAVEAMKR
ncbi:glycosyltransferase family 2 protein [Arabiibacter massiliensis]|uniref:glycosyltransferase family 2 protein n=1 Tax=Arabiibacter massiliensis TaxID=1870985 RepID=UPI0009BBA1AE|nr:glycosyltransferase family 2 protein [Arabiibacter massiliensis]